MNPIAPPLLAWFYKNQRSLPFRTQPSPYRVWVSEIMLQQTRVAAALPYYERFMAELPTPADLAACPPDRLDKLWEGLGYYSRVRNLQKAARIVCSQYGGQLPPTTRPCGPARCGRLHRPGPLPPSALGCRCPRWTATCCGCSAACMRTAAT